MRDCIGVGGSARLGARGGPSTRVRSRFFGPRSAAERGCAEHECRCAERDEPRLVDELAPLPVPLVGTRVEVLAARRAAVRAEPRLDLSGVLDAQLVPVVDQSHCGDDQRGDQASESDESKHAAVQASAARTRSPRSASRSTGSLLKTKRT